MDLDLCKTTLEHAGVAFAPGLSERDLQAAELHYGILFPPDLREYLSFALPSGKGFPDWRRLDDPGIVSALSWPLDGICFDIEYNEFWLQEWGPRPVELAAAFEVARTRVQAAPTLIPVRGHRYLPSEPLSAGNPVFSVYQTDIILYGADLENYLHNEYHYYFGTPEYSVSGGTRHIDFWSSLAQ